jgi:hypothetical protein
MVTLDDLADLPRLRLVKIDVEGMEGEVIEGAAKLIARFRPLLYVENDHPERSAQLMRRIDGLGYDIYWHIVPLFNPGNFYGVTENAFPGLVAFNMLCVHRESRIEIAGLEKVVDLDFHPLAPRRAE